MSRSRGFPVLLPLFLISVVVLAAYLVLTVWLHVPAGRFLDWVIGLASFWWLLAILTVPWDLHYESRAVEVEARESQARGIPVDEAKVAYARTWARRALVAALLLHAASALALFALSLFGVSPVGTVGAIAVLALTALRPLVRGYDYLRARLESIHGEIRYPREDVVELRSRVGALEASVEALRKSLDEAAPESWAARTEGRLAGLRRDLDRAEASTSSLLAENEVAHEKLARDARSAVAQITADGKFLENVREIIRFVKQA